jgi:hypothetical protein
MDKLYADSSFIIDLDRELFTLDHDRHFQLGTMPRGDGLWRVLYPEDSDSANAEPSQQGQLPSPGLELPRPVHEVGYASQTVVPRVDTGDARKRWLMRVIAEVVQEFGAVVRQLGKQWEPKSFPFRELAFALVWIASGKAKFLSFPPGFCHPRACMADNIIFGTYHQNDDSDVSLPDTGYFGRDWAGESAPLLEFGSLFHRPGQPAGASPPGTMYWLDDVLINLVLVPDGKAVTAAVAWGLQQGRNNFQLVVMSLSKVVLAEASTAPDANNTAETFVRVSHPLTLGPLSKEECISMGHPELAPDHRYLSQQERSRTQLYPGFAALITFFDVAGQRRSAAKSACILPNELHCRILDYVDYETWRSCSVVSPAFRAYCLLKYRIDDQLRIAPGFSPRPGNTNPLYSFAVERTDGTGTAVQLVERKRDWKCHGLPAHNWMPIVGAEPRALMVDVQLEFEDDGEEVAAESGGQD